MNNNPPKIARSILKFFRNGNDHETLLGDFDEIFRMYCEQKGQIEARTWYWRQVFKALPGFINYSLFWSFVMAWNYLKTALRNMKRYKGFTAINVFGLAAGMACAILILLWVRHELSYDEFHKNADEIYRVLLHYEEGGYYNTSGPGPLAAVLKERYPEIVNSARIFPDVTRPLKYEDKVFSGTLCGIEPSFFELFSFHFITGDPNSSAEGPDFIILTEETARKYFGNEDPLGKQMRFDWWGRWLEFTVTAVIKDVPAASHLEFDFLIPFSFVTTSGMPIDKWDAMAYITYVQLENGISHEIVEEKISGILNENLPTTKVVEKLEPILKIHLYDVNGGGPITYIYIFSTIGIMILLIACINFMNLSTARSINRTKEVGMRKVIGSTRLQLFKQFLCESVLLSLISFVFAICLAALALPYVNTILETEIPLDLSGKVILYLTGIILLTGSLAGSYPAVFLSGFQPVSVLKGIKRSGKRSGTVIRKTLVVTQFTLSVMLLICLVTVFRQLNYVKNKDLGFRKDQIINLEMGGNFWRRYDTIKNELLKNPEIVSMSRCNFAINRGFGTRGISWEGMEGDELASASIHSVDYDFLKTFNMEMASGRFFSEDFSSDATENVILNEAAVKAFGIESPLGKQFTCPLPLNSVRDGKIIGVIKDYNYKSLHSDIHPLVLVMFRYWHTDAYIQVNSSDIQETVTFIGSTLKEIVPDYAFEYRFMDENLEKLYKTERRAGIIIQYGTILGVVIACLGLYGLASFSIQNRTKEIGIRKVLGSPLINIFSLLSKDFVILVALANIISWPAAYLIMNIWLRNFAYRVDISFLTFFLSGSAALAVALITVSTQAIKAARANPVDSLRYE